MMIRQTTLVIGTSAILTASAAAANLLGNPSFENGTAGVPFAASTEFGGAEAFELTNPSNGEIEDWVWTQSSGTTGGAAWLRDTGDLFGTDGDHLLFLDPNQCIEWQDATVLTTGQTYRFDFNIAAFVRGQGPGGDDSGDATLLIEYEYTDTSGLTVFDGYTGPGDITAPANGFAEPGDLTFVDGFWDFELPSDYASDFRFIVTTSGGGMVLDNFSLMAVPEPSSAGLFGLALFALVARRKH